MPDVEHNPVSPDRKQRRHALDFMKRVIDCTQALESDLLCGPFYQPVGLFTGTGPTDEEKAAGRGARARVRRSTRQRPAITLAVEFLNRFEAYFLTTMDGVAEHVKTVGMPNFKAMFDTFHANIEEDDPVASIRAHRGDHHARAHLGEQPRGARARATTTGRASSRRCAPRATTTGSPSRHSAGCCPPSPRRRRSGATSSRAPRRCTPRASGSSGAVGRCGVSA